MKVLVVGGGGREHALAYKISQSPEVRKIYAAPGNAGIAALAECLPYGPMDIVALRDFAKEKDIDLTVVGPEAPLAAGIVDEFQKKHLRIFGPNKKAAQLESSKAYAKDLMRKYNIPTAGYAVFDEVLQAEGYIEGKWDAGKPQVVKASGLAAGKGVFVCDSKDDAIRAVRRIMVDKEFGDAGDQVVIERRLYGPEASIMAITDGYEIVFLPPSQDYKPIGDNDKGPNTGGMGAYTPVPIIGDQSGEFERGVTRTIDAMSTEGNPFKGVIYAAFMLTEDGPMILENNIRFGDPELQPVSMVVMSDIVPYLVASADGEMKDLPPLDIDPRPAVCLVLVSRGYPGNYEKGKLITGLDDVEREFGDRVTVFHAGTKEEDGRIYTNGGRVLGVTALSETIDEAADIVYAATEMIRFEGKTHRNDIGRNVLERGKR